MICTSYGTTDVAIPMQLELQGSRMEEILPHASVAKPQRRLRPFDWVLWKKSVKQINCMNDCCIFHISSLQTAGFEI